METIDKYTIYCTEKQVKRAIKLGAKIDYKEITDHEGHLLDYEIVKTPTAEQMIGWIEEQGLLLKTSKLGALVLKENYGVLTILEGSRKESTLNAIDVALEYLTKKRK